MPISPDPLLAMLNAAMEGIKLGDPLSVGDKLRPVLSNEDLFGVNLYNVGLGNLVERYFGEMLVGTGAVQATLKRYL